jgi:hypothetical protein
LHRDLVGPKREAIGEAGLNRTEDRLLVAAPKIQSLVRDGTNEPQNQRYLADFPEADLRD